MRRFSALVLLQFLFFASPALAQGNLGDLDTDKQMRQYGHIFGYVCGLGGALGVLLCVIYVLRGVKAEHSRGRQESPFQQKILDEKPKEPEERFMGERVPEWKIDSRLKATNAMLKYLARKDDWFDRKALEMIAAEAFIKVKEALELRSAKRVERRVHAECLVDLDTQIRKLRKKKQLRVFGQLEVKSVDFVHVEAPGSKQKHTFTALITAKSKDFIQDEESGEVLKGDKKYYSYQEFWTFRRTKEMWLLERMRPSGDMDRVLGEKNVLTQADLDKFLKSADPAMLREIAGV